MNIVNQLCFKIIFVLYCMYYIVNQFGFKIILVLYSYEVNT